MTATIFTTLCGAAWTLTYLLIIRQGFRDHTYGMPLVALSANLSWEFVYSFVHPHPPLQRSVNIVWLVFDLVILSQVLRFGPRQFGLPRALFAAVTGCCITIAVGLILFMRAEFDDPDGYYSAYGQSILMSALFLSMLAARRSKSGQSMGIAVSKFLGTAFASVGLSMYAGTPDGAGLLPFAFVVCAVLDLAYIVALAAVGRRAPRSQVTRFAFERAPR